MADVYKIIFQTTRGHQAGERDSGVSVRHASVVGVAAIHRSGGYSRSGGRRASAAAHQNV